MDTEAFLLLWMSDYGYRTFDHVIAQISKSLPLWMVRICRLILDYCVSVSYCAAH